MISATHLLFRDKASLCSNYWSSNYFTFSFILSSYRYTRYIRMRPEKNLLKMLGTKVMLKSIKILFKHDPIIQPLDRFTMNFKLDGSSFSSSFSWINNQSFRYLHDKQTPKNVKNTHPNARTWCISICSFNLQDCS